jgi:hypothetical protein
MSNVRQQLSIKKHREEFAQEQARKEAERLAPLRQAEQEFQRLAAEVAQKERELEVIDVFNAPSEELAKRCTPYTDDGTGRTVEQFKTMISDAFHSARIALEERGIELTASGIEKLNRVARINRATCDLTNSSTFETVFEYLDEIGALSRTDRIVAQRPVEEAPEPARVSLDELLETTPGTGANLPKLRQAVEDAAISEYFGPLLQRWLDHLRDDWSFTPNEQQLKSVQRFFERNNLSPLTFDNWNKARRALSDAGIFPPNMKTMREQADEEAENTRTLDSPSAKAAYLRRLRAFD